MKIRELRKAAGMTQRQLADLMGVGQTAVCNWETGANLPASDQLRKLADVLGCTIDALFGREETTA